MKNPELADILKRALRYIPQEGDEEMDLAEDIMAAIGGLQSEPTPSTGSITPGPWELRGSKLVTDSQGVVIAEKISANHPGTSEGNAQLISACPQMAEALRELLADKYLSDPVNADRMAKSRAALAKAGLL